MRCVQHIRGVNFVNMQHYFRIPVIASQEKREESSDLNGLTDQICQTIAKKLMNDEKFQAELMEILDNEEDE